MIACASKTQNFFKTIEDDMSSVKQSDPGHFFSMSPFFIFLRLKKVSWIALLATTYMIYACLGMPIIIKLFKIF